MRERAFVGMGSNLGDRVRYLARALDALRATPGIEGVRVSSLYETEPVGPPDQGPYLNAVAGLTTSLAPRELLDWLRAIEARFGRVRTGARNQARTLDLDVLLYGLRRIEEPDLVVPHPRMHLRAFALEPLCELAPDWIHPALGERIADLAERVRDPALVRRISLAAGAAGGGPWPAARSRMEYIS